MVFPPSFLSKWVIDWFEWVSEWVSECVSEWVSHVFIRKKIVVIGISTNFKWWNSGAGGRGWGCYNQGGLGPWRTPWKKISPKWKTKITSHPSYLRNSVSYDHDFWYTCVKLYLQGFFSFFQNVDFSGC